MGSSLFGSAPKASFSTQPTILPQQQSLLDLFAQLFTTGAQPAGVQSYGGTFSAPLNSVQNTSLAALEAQAMPQQPSTQQTQALDESFNTLSSALNYEAPKIDSTAAFQQGVVDPLTENFTSNVLPALDARYAGSAGGAFGSGRQQSNLSAAEDLDKTLSQTGSTFAYNTSTANQQADLQANQQRLAALGLAPSITAAPTALSSGFINNLMQILSAGSVPYNQAQTQVAGEYQDYLSGLSQNKDLMGLLAAAFGAPTVQTSGVGTGGSSGLVPGLLSGLAGPLTSAAFGNPMAMALSGGMYGGGWFSDERLKEDLEEIGDVDGIPLYRFRYKGDATPRLGFVAQDVERRVPEAVSTHSSGYKMVDYGRVLEDVLEVA